MSDVYLQTGATNLQPWKKPHTPDPTYSILHAQRLARNLAIGKKTENEAQSLPPGSPSLHEFKASRTVMAFINLTETQATQYKKL